MASSLLLLLLLLLRRRLTPSTLHVMIKNETRAKQRGKAQGVGMQNTPTPASSSSASSSSSAEEAHPKYSSCHNKAQEQNKGERHRGLECRILPLLLLRLLLLLLLRRRPTLSTLHFMIKHKSKTKGKGTRGWNAEYSWQSLASFFCCCFFFCGGGCPQVLFMS